LVEVMVACLILAVLALAGAMWLYRSRADVRVQHYRRLAIETANARLEQIRGCYYRELTAHMTPDYRVRYWVANPGSGLYPALDPGEQANIGGKSVPITTTLQYQDLDGGNPSYDCLQVTVGVRYRLNPAAYVTAGTLYAP